MGSRSLLRHLGSHGRDAACQGILQASMHASDIPAASSAGRDILQCPDIMGGNTMPDGPKSTHYLLRRNRALAAVPVLLTFCACTCDRGQDKGCTGQHGRQTADNLATTTTCPSASLGGQSVGLHTRHTRALSCMPAICHAGLPSPPLPSTAHIPALGGVLRLPATPPGGKERRHYLRSHHLRKTRRHTTPKTPPGQVIGLDRTAALRCLWDGAPFRHAAAPGT